MSEASRQDVQVVRELASRLAEVARDERQEAKREVWRTLHALESGRPPVLNRWFMAGYEFLPQQMRCTDPLLRGLERCVCRRRWHNGQTVATGRNRFPPFGRKQLQESPRRMGPWNPPPAAGAGPRYTGVQTE